MRQTPSGRTEIHSMARERKASTESVVCSPGTKDCKRVKESAGWSSGKPRSKAGTRDSKELSSSTKPPTESLKMLWARNGARTRVVTRKVGPSG
jgi:hypothetical protein